MIGVTKFDVVARAQTALGRVRASYMARATRSKIGYLEDAEDIRDIQGVLTETNDFAATINLICALDTFVREQVFDAFEEEGLRDEVERLSEVRYLQPRKNIG
ncbi:MAG: hypothetical protein HC836_10685 [Richelia sp. RM2_1_2]|nr:hypothetical protein [Richelia sp. RM2_1_2]